MSETPGVYETDTGDKLPHPIMDVVAVLCVPFGVILLTFLLLALLFRYVP